MKDNILADILQLINTEGIGPVTFYKYVQSAGSVSAALSKAAEKYALCNREFAENEIRKAQKAGIRILSFLDSEYPQNLKNIADAPPVLYALGNISLLNYPAAVAIVGARNASINGRKIASRIAYDLTENDVLVISGMARGIDCSAHKGALYAKNQKGPTIAVLGTGIDVIYPAENADIYRKIGELGLLISEFPLGTAAQVSNFPRRNRIISGLSAGTLVVEAGLHSGSLITAKAALEQGKDVFAVPGSPLESRALGPNYLIKEGALLTESAEDILNSLTLNRNFQLKTTVRELKPLDKPQNNVNIPDKEQIPAGKENSVPLLELISYSGIDIDELLRDSGMPQADFFMEILNLEFLGKIERQAGNRVARIK